MKKFSIGSAVIAAALITGLAVAPAVAADNALHDHQHGAVSTPAPADKAKPVKPSASKGKVASTPENMMDMNAMCDMHMEMMSSKSKSERQSMMDEEMKGLSAAN